MIRCTVVLAAAVLGLSACGGDNSTTASVVTSAPTTTSTAKTSTATASTTVAVTASPALCAARQDLRASVQDLQNVDVVKNGTTAVKDALTKVKDNLAAVRAVAQNDLQPQITAFDNALKRLDTAVATPGVAAVASALKDVVQTGTTLLADLGRLSCS
jgi:hypothetical protein